MFKHFFSALMADIKAIRSIQIQLSTIKKQKLSPLIFDQHCIIAEGFQFLATDLKFLYWYNYPLKSLPENFSTERLVIYCQTAACQNFGME